MTEQMKMNFVEPKEIFLSIKLGFGKLISTRERLIVEYLAQIPEESIGNSDFNKGVTK